MRDGGAVHTALALAQTPSLVHEIRPRKLPSDVRLVLEISAGDQVALKDAMELTGASEQVLRAAAVFYIEQVLFDSDANSYKVLGGNRHSSTRDLRANMALLMRWLHPDVAHQSEGPHELDRSVFAGRVTEAWEDLKTAERRREYDARLGRLAVRQTSQPRVLQKRMGGSGTKRTDGKRRRRRTPQLVMVRLEREGFFARLWRLVRG